MMLNVFRDTFLMKTSFKRCINTVEGNCTFDGMDIKAFI